MHLLEIIKVVRFDRVGVCLDVGAPENDKGIDEAFELLAPRIAQLHFHDSKGQRDNHPWPASGHIDWKKVAKHIATLPRQHPRQHPRHPRN